MGRLKEIPGLRKILRNSVIFSLTSVVLLLNNFSDQYFVVQLGRMQAAAYTLDVPFFWILVSASAALGAVYSADVKNLLEKNDRDGANRSAVSAAVYSVIFGFVFSLFTGIMVLIAFNLVPEKEIGELAFRYMLPMLVMFFVLTLNSVLGGLLNAEGKFWLYVIALVLFLAGNATFDYIFLNMGLGIFGNGLSTVCGGAISLAFELAVYATGRTTIKLSMKNFSWSRNVLKDTVMRIRKFLVRHLTKDIAELCIRFTLYLTYTTSYGVPMMYSTLIATIGAGAGGYLSGEYRRLLREGDRDQVVSLFLRSSALILVITLSVALIFHMCTDILVDPYVPYDGADGTKNTMMWTLGVLCFTSPFVGLKYLANAVSAPVGRMSHATILLGLWASTKVIAFVYFVDISYKYAIYVILAERILSALVSIALALWHIYKVYPRTRPEPVSVQSEPSQS